MSKELYFIAITPGDPLLSELQSLKNYVAKKYQTKRVLRSPPHITLVPPFRVEELGDIGTTLNSIGLRHIPFKIELSNFSFFSKEVVFVDVVSNSHLTELYNDLRASLDDTLTQKMKKIFYPHITIGLSDMGYINFGKAKEEFEGKEFKGRFEVNQIDIFKHDGKKWNLFRSTKLIGPKL